MMMVALPCLLVLTFMEVMSICFSVNTLDISANMPILLLANILISVEYCSLLVAPSAICHSASMSLPRSSSGRLIMLMQSVRWMDTPLPLVTNPTISSPGTGLQHLEKRTARSWMPLTTIPLLDLRTVASPERPAVSAMPLSTSSSVISRFNFFSRSSSILLMTWPSFRPPCPMDASTESQSLNA